MKFWQSLAFVELDQIIACAKFAEELGFYGVSFGDHLVTTQEQVDEYLYTKDGTATAGVDYAPIFRQLVRFGDNELSKTIPITIFADPTVDGNETVILSLRNPTGGPVRAQR